MRYIVRAVKYFFQLMVILALIIAILVVAKVVDADISKIFVNGYDSLWQIALMMAAFAAIYPRFGYVRRQALVPGADEEVEPVLRRVMESHGRARPPLPQEVRRRPPDAHLGRPHHRGALRHRL